MKFTITGFCSILWCCFLSLDTRGAEFVEVSPVLSDWIDPTTWNGDGVRRNRGNGDGDTHYLLYERQVNAAGEKPEEFRRVVYQCLTESGVQENSQIEISFAPEYETLQVNSLLVHRDEESYDRLSDQEIRVIQKEEEMNRHLYDGRLTAVIVLEDIRVGDVLEYSYTIGGENPIYEGRFMMSFSTQWSSPLDKLHVRVRWPSARQLRIRNHGPSITPTVERLSGVDEYLWSTSDISQLFVEDDLPHWFEPWGYVQLSDFVDWREVVDWTLGIYQFGDEVPGGLKDVISKLDAIEDGGEKALQAIRFVQDEFRYLGFESGINSHKPYSVETIVSRRFGDCKDKSVLLCTILRNLGFEAYPALVNSSERRAIAEWLPSIDAFDHVVVQLRMDGRIVWIDPTIRLQGGEVEYLHFPDYGHALVVAPDTESLEEIHLSEQSFSFQETIEAIDFQDFSGNALLRVTTTFRGAEADRMRRRLSRQSVSEIGRDYSNFYASIYDGVRQVDPLGYHDDRMENVLTTFETYSVSGFWTQEAEDDVSDPKIWAGFDASVFESFLEMPATRDRAMPFALEYPKEVCHEIRVQFPWPLEFEESEVLVDSEELLASHKSSTSDGGLRLAFAFQAKSDAVAPEDFEAYIADIDRIKDQTFYNLPLPAEWACKPGTMVEEKEEISEEEGEPGWLEENSRALAWIGGILFVLMIAFVGTVFVVIVVVSKRPASKAVGPPPLPRRLDP